MAIKVTVFNPKGGVGKTTSAKCIAGDLSKRGYKVLLVDCDSSADMTRGIAHSVKPEYELAKLIMEYCDEDFVYDEEAVKDCICPSDFPNLDIMPASPSTMQEADSLMMRVDKMFEPDRAFAVFFENLEKEYDFIIYDTKEGEGEWLRNVLNHVEYLICPSEPSPDSVAGYAKVLKKLNLYRRSNPSLKFLGLFVTNFKNDSRGHDIVRTTREATPEYFIPVAIRSTTILDSASLVKAPVCYYNDDSNPAIDYRSLTDYLIEHFGSQLTVDPSKIRAFDTDKLTPYTMLAYPDVIKKEYSKGIKMYNKVIAEYKTVADTYEDATGETVRLPDINLKDDSWLCNHDEEYDKILEEIKRNGITEPLLVTPLNSEGYYMIIDGAKRRDAAIELGLETPICIKWKMNLEDDFTLVLMDLAKNQMSEKIDYANSATRKLKEKLSRIKDDAGNKEVNNG